MTILLDPNILIRHLTGDPPAQAKRATRFLAAGDDLLLVDVVFAECVYVLESFYEVKRDQVAALMRATVAFEAIEVIDQDLLLRTLELYEIDRMDFADAYLVASAELMEIAAIASFDRGLDRIETVKRLSP